jgi:FixJ family two-component response regulator
LLATRASTKPVIMVTAHTEPGLESKVLASGAICLLGKPFRIDDPIGCLEKALSA